MPDDAEAPAVAEKAVVEKVKPLPKPDESDRDNKMDSIAAKVNVAQDRISEIKSAIEAKKGIQKGARSGNQSIRDELKTVRDKRQKKIEEKKAIRAKYGAVGGPRIDRDKEKKKSDRPRYSLEEIERKVKMLKMRHQTESMSIQEEKTLMKEVKALTASKGEAAAYEAKRIADKAAYETSKEQRGEMIEALKEKDAEIDALKVHEDRFKAQLDASRAKEVKETSAGGSFDELISEREALRKTINDLYDEKRKYSQDFKKLMEVWYDNDRLVRAQVREEKQRKWEAGREEREVEQKAWEAEQASMPKKDPFEYQKALVQNLVIYLKEVSGANKEATVVAEAKAAPKLAGGRAIGKKQFDGDEDDQDGFNKLRKKKKNKRKKGGKNFANKLVHPAGKLSAMNELSVPFPETIEDCTAMIATLEAKVVEYDALAAAGKKPAARKRQGNSKPPSVVKLSITATSETKMTLAIVVN